MSFYFDFLFSCQPRLEELGRFVETHGLEDLLKADHISYKCESSEEFERIRRVMEVESRFIYQSVISERRVALIGLAGGLPTPLGSVSLLELAAPKPDGDQISGFDHLEAYPSDTAGAERVSALHRLVRGLCSQPSVNLKQVKRPHHITWDILLEDGFKLRLEEEPLMNKVAREEMGVRVRS